MISLFIPTHTKELSYLFNIAAPKILLPSETELSVIGIISSIIVLIRILYIECTLI